jgi:probable rRNA maturation factor
MSYQIDLQIVSKNKTIPKKNLLKQWAAATLTPFVDTTEVTLRIVDEEESAQLNQTYRNKPKSTNVLAFPFEAPPELKLKLLGDIVICAPVVEKEAMEQDKNVTAHWAHMVVHGLLHLLDFDHIKDVDAEKMEAEEKKILKALGFPDPYCEEQISNG